jgi:hypothetical protein
MSTLDYRNTDEHAWLNLSLEHGAGQDKEVAREFEGVSHVKFWHGELGESRQKNWGQKDETASFCASQC